MTAIPKPPRSGDATIQSPETRRLRINNWVKILSVLPYIEMQKGPNPDEDSDNVRGDNQEDFDKSLLAVSVNLELDFPNEFLLTYCFFLEDGSFLIKNEYGLTESDDSRINTLIKYHGVVADTWAEGFKVILEMLNTAFPSIIPEPPVMIEYPSILTTTKLETTLRAWQDAFAALEYCDTIAQHNVDWKLGPALWIIYFTSHEVYMLSKECDLFCGLVGDDANPLNESNRHEIFVGYDELEKLPEIYEKVRAELQAAWGNGDLPLPK